MDRTQDPIGFVALAKAEELHMTKDKTIDIKKSKSGVIKQQN